MKMSDNEHKKRILMFSDWFLPSYKAGGPITSCANLVEHLSSHFEFWIVTRNTDYCETQPFNGIESDCWINRGEGLYVFYFSAEKLNLRNIKNLIKKTPFDLAYINGVYSFYFSLLPLLLLKFFTKTKVIVAPRGMLSDHAVGVKPFRKKSFLLVARLVGLYRKVVFHATHSDEAGQIAKNLGSRVKTVVAPNLPAKRVAVYKNIEKQSGTLRLFSLARISPEKNTLFAINCLQNITSAKIEFHLYGAIYNSDYWAVCQKAIAQLPNNVSVKYCGSISPNEVQTCIAQYHFLLMPSLGENFGHAIIESFICGRPVIISDNTPWRNLSEKQIGWDISLKNPDEFSRIIQLCCLKDQQNYDLLSKSAFNYATTITANTDTLTLSLNLIQSQLYESES